MRLELVDPAKQDFPLHRLSLSATRGQPERPFAWKDRAASAPAIGMLAHVRSAALSNGT